MNRTRLAIISVIALASLYTHSHAADHDNLAVRTDALPHHNYPVSGPLLAWVSDEQNLDSFRRALREDLVGDLQMLNISDEKTLKRYHKTLLRLDLLEHRYESALANLESIRSLESKGTKRLLDNLVPTAILATSKGQLGNSLGQAFSTAFRDNLRNLVAALPWADVRDAITEAKATAEFLSKDLLMGVAQTELQPQIEATGKLDFGAAMRLLQLVYLAEVELPLNPMIAEVYGEYIEQNNQPMADFWGPRKLPDPSKQQNELIVGIWDSGVDVSVFPNNLWTNPHEAQNGKDDDGNGYVDDLHGVAFGIDGGVADGLLLPLGTQAGEVEASLVFMQGFWDMLSGIESEAATAAQKQISTLPADQVSSLVNTLSLATHYLHGTHVAGIAMADNPQAKILVVRSTFDHKVPSDPLDVNTARKLVESYNKIISYFAQQGVRVVNMSWNIDFETIESGLAAANIGSTDEERTKLAREVLQVIGDGLAEAISGTPHILYVNCAGNEDSDVDFDLAVPSSFALPNLLVVGALDKAGNPASFTSYGKNVRVYANGHQVDSYIPGGGRMLGSGTSMSAPAATNLAARLLANDPSLTPVQVIALIENGADPHPDNAGILRINPSVTYGLSLSSK